MDTDRKDKHTLLDKSLKILVVLCALFPVTPAQAWEGVVVNVHDGDTVVVAPHGATHGDLSVRLYGIDAPELNQPGGDAARASLAQSVHPGEIVNIIPLSDDRYHRVVALIIHDRQTLNYEQVRQGQAWVYTKYCKARFCREWNDAEQSAREAE